MELVVAVMILVVLNLAAWRWGVDSRVDEHASGAHRGDLGRF
jgi:hypothetical protein